MAATTGLRLHLGSHTRAVRGWENLDSSPNVYLSRVPALQRALHRARIVDERQAAARFPREVVHADVRKGLPYPDASAAYVYSSHMIEHLARWQALELVRECRRVLHRGGVLRLATPDLAAWAREYLDGDTTAGPTPADSFMEKLATFRDAPGSTAQRFVRRVAGSSQHQWLYDAESLSYLLREGGFPDPELRRFREGDVPDLDQLEDHADSLFVEARRP